MKDKTHTDPQSTPRTNKTIIIILVLSSLSSNKQILIINQTTTTVGNTILCYSIYHIQFAKWALKKQKIFLWKMKQPLRRWVFQGLGSKTAPIHSPYYDNSSCKLYDLTIGINLLKPFWFFSLRKRNLFLRLDLKSKNGMQWLCGLGIFVLIR